MKYKIAEIREDEQGDLWFLVEGYYQPERAGHDGPQEDWWLHLSDEYSYWKREDGPVNGKQYRLVEVEKTEK